ncbi:ABC transporter permease [Demequina muriae]|uniref:ABC transporter permease n=1 Tax=Demequina muriae TaxID=3051664 RepID=A0ABT8GIC3_9MICO|nr:ABC transporter permease [Demequina sp. EGI L300058]MDN4481188.1 ABC transporter permease [Demequina sp. EGI L300058]
MNVTVMRLTARGLLGRRRALLLVILPALLLVLAALTRWASDGSPSASSMLANGFAMGTLLPLMCLLVATGVIGAEIDDGSIVYMLAKPLKRRVILFSKLAVGLAAVLLFAVLPIMAAVAIAGDEGGQLTLAFGVSAAFAAVAYTAIFVTLGIVTRNAVVFGLLYALLWETVLGGYVPGIRAVSVRQWALSVGEQMLGSQAAEWSFTSEVGIATGLILLALTTAGAVYLGARKLSTLTLNSVD